MENKKAFTLIELLVVISIIAMLLSLLMPALTKAKESARKVVCQNNLRQQAVAINTYMGDYKEKYPSAADAGLTYYAYGGKQGTEYTTQTRLLNPYVGRLNEVNLKTEDSVKVFRCPSDRGGDAGKWPERKPTIWDTLGWSYLYNSSALNNDGAAGLWGKRNTQIKRTDMCVLVADWPSAAYFINYNPFQKIYWHHKKENGWANTAFVDGHIKFLQFTRNSPDFQNGEGWTVLYNGPKFR